MEECVRSTANQIADIGMSSLGDNQSNLTIFDSLTWVFQRFGPVILCMTSELFDICQNSIQNKFLTNVDAANTFLDVRIAFGACA